jgi:branched-chain amino acid transport system substrate-binding protein
VIVNPVSPWVFKCAPRDDDAVRRLYTVMKSLSLTRIAVTSSNTGFGKAGKAQLEKLAPEYGIEIVTNEVYEKEATDLTGMLTKIKAAKVLALVNWSIEPAQAILAKNMKQLGMAIPLFQSHGFANIRYAKEAGAAAEGIIFPAGRLMVAGILPKSNPQKSLCMQYKNDYETRFKDDVSTFGGHAYDALLLIGEAVRKAGSSDREKVRAAMEEIKGLPGTAGIFNLSATDHNGLDTSAFEMLVVKKGRFALYGGK